jgi:predicted nucleotidyltransferase
MIVFKTIGVEGSLRNMFSSIHRISVAYIYGSYARRKEKSSSDIDLMIIGNPDTSLLNEKIAELEKRLNREINPTIYSMEEYRAKKKAKSGFIMELLKNPKIMVIGKEDDL